MNNGNTVIKTGGKGFWRGMGRKIVSFLSYLKSFKWVVDIARWIQDTGAVIAESAFTLAIIYVIIFTFGHLLIAWVPGSVIAVINQVVMITFTILPELVMIPIILTTWDHFRMWKGTKDRRSGAWTAAYAILTVLFIAMTLILLAGLQGGIKENTTQATGYVFILRCFSGLFYTVLQRLWDGKGKNSYFARYSKMDETIHNFQIALSQKETSLSDFQIALSQLQTSVEVLEQEKATLSVALAQKKLSRNVTTEVTTEAKKVTTGLRDTFAVPQEKVTMLLEEEEEVTTEANNITPININAHREKIKTQIIKEVQSGSKKINYRKVAANAGVSYGTVNKYKEDIIKEISQELPAIAK